MTYCVGLQTKQGLVFMSDTRTNAGVDNVSVFRKMHSWSVPGNRVITLLTAGNLATTQSVISILEERTKAPSERNPSIYEAPSMIQIARLVGATLKEIIQSNAKTGQSADSAFNASIILGGQIAGIGGLAATLYRRCSQRHNGHRAPRSRRPAFCDRSRRSLFKLFGKTARNSTSWLGARQPPRIVRPPLPEASPCRRSGV